MASEKHIEKAGKKLRLGFTTGTCAALAASAAARMLLSGAPVLRASLMTPKGIPAEADIVHSELSGGVSSCAVRKDAGDDPDCTDGILIYASVRKAAGSGVHIDGGAGVGRITRPGLEQPVGAAAINRVPRAMIARAAEAVSEEFGYDGGLSVVISVPEGTALAARTFNPSLGITGGISIIGTSGVVEPMSTRAIVDTIAAELKMHRAEGAGGVILTPGNYGTAFLEAHPEITMRPVVKCSNFIGEAIDTAAGLGFSGILAAGHIGKLIKLAGGIMDTHSRTADCRLELLALHAALCGGGTELVRDIVQAVTADDGLRRAEEAGLREPVIASLLGRIDWYLARRAAGACSIGAVLFGGTGELLGITPNGAALLEHWKGRHG